MLHTSHAEFICGSRTKIALFKQIFFSTRLFILAWLLIVFMKRRQSSTKYSKERKDLFISICLSGSNFDIEIEKENISIYLSRWMCFVCLPPWAWCWSWPTVLSNNIFSQWSTGRRNNTIWWHNKEVYSVSVHHVTKQQWKELIINNIFPNAHKKT